MMPSTIKVSTAIILTILAFVILMTVFVLFVPTRDDLDKQQIPLPMDNGLYTLSLRHRVMHGWLEQHPGWIVVSASQGDGRGRITYTIRKESKNE